MFWDSFLGLLVLLSFLCAVTRGDAVVSCELGHSCIFPCTFPEGDEVVIHWIKEEPGEPKVFSYYYDQDQLALQSQQFRGRTSLFQDQISRGNASLRLTAVQVQDAGRYKCYTGTLLGQLKLFVVLNVDSPVRYVDADHTVLNFTCSSEGIYPEPAVSWSTIPPSNLTLQDKTSVKQNEHKLFSISSTVVVPHGNLSISCTVKTHKNQKKVTFLKPESVTTSGTEVTILCTAPPAPQTRLLWRFNHHHIILNQTGGGAPAVSDEWRSHVSTSQTANLKLQRLTSRQGGTYTCEVSNTEETLRTETHLTIEETQDEAQETSSRKAIIIGSVVGVIVFFGVLTVAVWRWKKNKVRNQRWTYVLRPEMDALRPVK